MGRDTQDAVRGRPSPRYVALLAVAVIGLVAGCWRSSGPAVQFVEGKVLLDGQPLEGATVGLSPAPGSPALPAYARTDATGVFRVTSTRGGRRDAGATVGEYIVTVSKVESEADAAIEDPDHPDYRKKPTAVSRAKQPKNIVPDVYGEVGTSPLRMSVQRGANTGPAFVFDLKADGSTGDLSPR